MHQLVVPAVAAAQPQEACGQDAAFEKGVELVLHKSRQVGTGGGLKPPRRRWRRAAAPQRYSVVCSGRWRSQWTGAPSGTRRGCRLMACTRGSRACDLGRSQAARCASVARCAAYLGMPHRCGNTFGGLGARATGRFEATSSRQRMSLMGRQEPLVSSTDGGIPDIACRLDL